MIGRVYYIPYADLSEACILFIDAKQKSLAAVRSLPMSMLESFSANGRRMDGSIG